MWTLLTEPSPNVPEGLERRQARILAAMMTVILPVWSVTVLATVLTRKTALSWQEWVLTVFTNVAALGAYLLSRTRWYRLGSIILIVVAAFGAAAASLGETDRLRAVVSMLYGTTGALYAAVLLNTRATLLASLAIFATFILFGAVHPALTTADFVLPLFLLGFLLSLTVVASGVREDQLKVIEAQSARLSATLESAMDAVIVVDLEGRVTAWSHRAESLFQVAAAQATNHPLWELVGAGEESLRLSEAMRQGGATRFEFESQRGDRRVAFEASMAPQQDGSGAVVVLRDVTERKQLEARLMMTDRLETMGRLVAGVAHEINNPLAYVQANLRALAEDVTGTSLPTQERKELLAEAIDGTQRIQRIVKDLLTFSRSGGAQDVPTPVDVEATLERALRIAEVHALNARARFIRQFSGVGTVMAIESRLGQVFLTLVVNAIQALPSSGGRREVLVSTRRDGATLIVGVRDFGEGMSPDVRARLFTPFFTTKPVGKGTGLGLSIAHSIIASLAGEIRVESAKGQGALFEVVLPCQESRDNNV